MPQVALHKWPFTIVLLVPYQIPRSTMPCTAPISHCQPKTRSVNGTTTKLMSTAIMTRTMCSSWKNLIFPSTHHLHSVLLFGYGMESIIGESAAIVIDRSFVYDSKINIHECTLFSYKISILRSMWKNVLNVIEINVLASELLWILVTYSHG